MENLTLRIFPVQLHLFTSSSGVSCRRSSSLFSPRLSVVFSFQNITFSGFKLRASLILENADETEKKEIVQDSFSVHLFPEKLLGKQGILNFEFFSGGISFLLFGLVTVLKVYPFSATVAPFQLGCGSVLAILMWALNLHKRPKISKSQSLVLTVLRTMGNLLTNVSFGKVAVSFTYTIKAMDPFCAVVLTAMFLGELTEVTEHDINRP